MVPIYKIDFCGIKIFIVLILLRSGKPFISSGATINFPFGYAQIRSVGACTLTFNLLDRFCANSVSHVPVLQDINDLS
jgi:hypothetical protein